MAVRGYTIVVHRDGALDSRQVHVAGWVARAAAVIGVLLIAGGTALGIAYGPILSAAARAPLLERDVARLERENGRVAELARTLDEAEARYAHLRGMLGGDVFPGLGAEARTGDSLFVAPALFARAPDAGALPDSLRPSVPSRWPLSVRAFRTRGLAAGDSAETHTGLDLAVRIGSDVRAAGGGTVKRTGEDPAYGLFVEVMHPEGYETMYGHLSRVLVARGDRVGPGQVIALSGNSGRSTAPHLHFEVRQNGRSVDPLSLVREGN